MIKEKSILFSSPMVQAILDERKTKTRRVVVSKHDDLINAPGVKASGLVYFELKNHPEFLGISLSSKYNRGDILWVREPHYVYGHWEKIAGNKTSTGKQKWKFVPDSDKVLFTAPISFLTSKHKSSPESPKWYKRLGRFMPKKYCRLWIEVEDIRVERLQAISEDDARAEGIEYYKDEVTGRIRYKDYMADASGYGDPSVDYPTVGMPIASFATLWEKVNGTESWNANPWVWVISFKVLSTTGKPKNL